MEIEYKGLLVQALDVIFIFLPASVCLALAGLPFMSIFGQILAKIRQRSFYDKCARQLAKLAMWLGFFLIIGASYEIWPYLERVVRHLWEAEAVAPAGVESGAGIVAAAAKPEVSALDISFALCWFIWVCSWFFSSLYFSTWSMLKSFPIIHRGLAFLGGFFAFCGLYTIVVIRLATGIVDASGKITLYEIFVPPMDFSMLILAVFIPPLVFAMAGGFGAAWLVLRRGRDDFGRDYYNLMTPWCAAWARNSWFLVWLLLLVQGGLDLWLIWDETGSIPPDYPFRDLGMFMVLWFIPVLLWHIVVGSLTPLRHKLAIFIAPMMLMGFLYVMIQ